MNQVLKIPKPSFFPLHHDASLRTEGSEITVGSWAQHVSVGKHATFPNGKRKVTNACSEARERGGGWNNQNIKCPRSKKP